MPNNHNINASFISTPPFYTQNSQPESGQPCSSFSQRAIGVTNTTTNTYSVVQPQLPITSWFSFISVQNAQRQYDNRSSLDSLPTVMRVSTPDIEEAEAVMLHHAFPLPDERSERDALIYQIHKFNNMLPLEKIAAWATLSKSYVKKIIKWEEVNLQARELEKEYGSAPTNKDNKDALIYRIHNNNTNIPHSVIAKWAKLNAKEISKVLFRVNKMTLTYLKEKYGDIPKGKLKKRALIYKIYTSEANISVNTIAKLVDMPTISALKAIQQESHYRTKTRAMAQRQRPNNQDTA